MKSKYKNKHSQRQKSFRAEYKIVKGTPKERERKLYFLRSAIYQMGFNMKTAAEKAGFKPQGLEHWFVVDDAPFEDIDFLLECLGVKISVSFEGDTIMNEIVTEGIISVKGTFPMMNKKDNACLLYRIERGGRLLEFAKAIRNTGDSLTEVAKKMKTDYFNLSSWIMADTIKFSKLYNFAKAYNLGLVINVKRV